MAIVDRVNRGIESIAEEFGELLVTNLKQGLKDEGKSNSGSLVNSIRYTVKTNSDGKAVLALEAEDYLRFVDKGRKPGTFPNITAISKWARAKGISQRAVFPIAKKIADEGIEATNVVSTSIDKTVKAFLPKYKKQLTDLLGVVIMKDIFNQTTTKGKILPKNLR